MAQNPTPAAAATAARATVPAIKLANSPASVTSPSASASSTAAPASTPSTHLKKFTFAQISDKVSKRRQSVPEYESLLLACRVRADADGAVFDSTHPAWSMLLHLCTVADTLAKEAAAARAKQHAAAVAAAAAAAEATGTEPAPVPEPPELAPIVVHSRDFPLPPQRIDQLPPAHVQMSPATPSGSAAGSASAASKQLPTPHHRKSPHVSPSTSAKKKKALKAVAPEHQAHAPTAATAAGAAAGKGSSSRSGGGASSVSLSAVTTSTVTSPPAPGQAGGPDDEWVSVRVKGSSSSPAQHKLLTQANVPPPSALSHAASSLFSQSTMSRAASALDKFSRAITARPVAQQPPNRDPNRSTSSERRAAILKASHADRPISSQSSSGGGKSSSNSSRDVSLVREDLEFEAMLAREYEAANNAKAKATAAAEAAAEGESKADGAAAPAATAAAPPAGAASKDSELLAQFVSLIAPTVTTPDITAIKSICKVIGVPHKHRGQLWNVLLGVKQHDPVAAAGSAGAPSASRARLMSLPREMERPTDHESDPETDAAMAAAHAAAAAAAAAARTTSPSPTVGSQPTSPTPPDVDAAAAFAAVVASGVAPTSPGQCVSPPPAGGTAAPSTSTAASTPSSADGASTPASTHTKFDLHNQRVIRADIERTLPHLKTFQDPNVRHDMEVILTSYCKEHGVSYKQGMNYVLAPLFLLNLPSREDILRIYEAVISRLLNNTFVDNEFGSLQCTFLLFKLNLAYHDPELAVYLESNDMGPELFASSWFITLFSNRCKLSVLFYLWDCLILDNNHDALLSFWVSLALLIQHRQSILAESIVMLPESLSKLSILSKKEASILVNRAKKLYRGCSSLTARRQLRDYTSRKISMDSLDYHLLAAQVSLTVSEEELVKSCYDQIKLPILPGEAAAEAAAAASGGADSTQPPPVTSLLSSSTPPLKFFILDCRPIEQYEAGHLPCAYHLDPDLLLHPADLSERIDSLTSMKGCHFCFLGEGGEAPGTTAAAAAAAAQQNGFDGRNGAAGTPSSAAAAAAATSPASQSAAAVRALLLAFLKRGFKYLSRCEGGYAACHALILASDHALELVDHDQTNCLECTGRRVKTKEKKQSFLQSFRKQIGQLTQGKGERDAEKNAAAPEVSVEEYQSQNVPDSAVVLLMQPGTVASPGSASPSSGSSNLSLRLLHTVLRDKNVDVSAFADCMHRLTSILLAAFFDRVETKERNVSTGAGALFTGLESTPVTTIAPHPIAMELLDSAFHPYRPVCKRQSATFVADGASTNAAAGGDKVEASASTASSAASPASSLVRRPSTATSSSASSSPPAAAGSGAAAAGVPAATLSFSSVSVPSNLTSSNILLFVPILSVEDLPLLLSVLSELQSNHDAHASQITVLSILVARPVLWRIAEAHPEVLLLATGVDELTAQNRMVPGISKWEERYRLAQS